MTPMTPSFSMLEGIWELGPRRSFTDAHWSLTTADGSENESQQCGTPIVRQTVNWLGVGLMYCHFNEVPERRRAKATG